MPRAATMSSTAFSPISNLSFLIVERRGAQRRELGEMLGSLGARHVHEAADGVEALAMLRTLDPPPDVILSDIDMPGMDGLEFIRHLGASPCSAAVILASNADAGLVKAVGTMGASYGVKVLGAISKPITPFKLVGAVQPPVVAPKGWPAEPRKLSLEPMNIPRPTLPLAEIMRGLADDQFEPFFQPTVEMATGRIVGAAALARWRHPVMGKVEPYAFIKPLRDSGDIDSLTWTMLRKSAQCCAAWRDAGVDTTVTVKLGFKALGQDGLADRITETVAGRGISPAQMVLEVVDCAVAARDGGALENLARLRLYGFGLSIKDWGTGQASMRELGRIAFTELKVDRGFVSGAAEEPFATSLPSMLRFTKATGIISIAEGIESQLEWDRFAALGCDLARGFFITAPMDAEAHLAWAARKLWVPERKAEVAA